MMVRETTCPEAFRDRNCQKDHIDRERLWDDPDHLIQNVLFARCLHPVFRRCAGLSRCRVRDD